MHTANLSFLVRIERVDRSRREAFGIVVDEVTAMPVLDDNPWSRRREHREAYIDFKDLHSKTNVDDIQEGAICSGWYKRMSRFGLLLRDVKIRRVVAAEPIPSLPVLSA